MIYDHEARGDFLAADEVDEYLIELLLDEAEEITELAAGPREDGEAEPSDFATRVAASVLEGEPSDRRWNDGGGKGCAFAVLLVLGVWAVIAAVVALLVVVL